MFGTGEKYYFYLQFYAQASDLWYQASTLNKDFILLFQMGDTLSEWTGVHQALDQDLNDDAVTPAGQFYIYDMTPLSVTNEVKTQGKQKVLDDGRNNSDFAGQFIYSRSDNSVNIVLIRETL